MGLFLQLPNPCLGADRSTDCFGPEHVGPVSFVLRFGAHEDRPRNAPRTSPRTELPM
jgi:hypothetical protein